MCLLPGVGHWSLIFSPIVLSPVQRSQPLSVVIAWLICLSYVNPKPFETKRVILLFSFVCCSAHRPYLLEECLMCRSIQGCGKLLEPLGRNLILGHDKEVGSGRNLILG